jgi:hypothetical protein
MKNVSGRKNSVLAAQPIITVARVKSTAWAVRACDGNSDKGSTRYFLSSTWNFTVSFTGVYFGRRRCVVVLA